MDNNEFSVNNKTESNKIISSLSINTSKNFSNYSITEDIPNEESFKFDDEILVSEFDNIDTSYYDDVDLEDSVYEPNYNDNDNYGLNALQQYRHDVEQFPLLTTEQEKELFNRYKNGDLGAKELIINSNLRLVMKIANEYKGSGVQVLDLIQEGNIGLQKAVERFDIDKGYKLSTYATWWIRQAIMRFIPSASLQYHIPVHVDANKWKIIKAERDIAFNLGREATMQELVAKTGIDAEEIKRIKIATTRAASLHKSVGEEEDAVLGDLIADDKGITRHPW